MPIVVEVGPKGVEKAFVRADSESAEDAVLAIWPVVRDQLKRLDRKLRIADKPKNEAGSPL
jgi:hypothetical protein